MLLHRCTPPVRCMTARSAPSITRRSAPAAALARPCCTLPSVGFSSSTFAGSSLRLARPGARQQQGIRLIVQANGKHSMGATGGGTRRKRTRKSGFMARSGTVGGRKVLKARRKKGRHELCPCHSRGKTRK